MGFQLRGRTKGKSSWLNYSSSPSKGLRGSLTIKPSKNVTTNYSKNGVRTTINLGNGLKWVSSSKKQKVAKIPLVKITKQSPSETKSSVYSAYVFDAKDLDYVPPASEPFVFSEWIRSMDAIAIISSLMIPVFAYFTMGLFGGIFYSILAAFVAYWCVITISYCRSIKTNRSSDDLPLQLFAYPFILPGLLFFTPAGWFVILCTFLIFLFI